MAPDLPTELWLRIVHFVHDDSLPSLFKVNRAFYDLTMDRLYRHLVLDDDRPPPLVSRLGQIEKDAHIRGTVNTVSVYPRAIRSACLRSGRGIKKLRKAHHRDWPDTFRNETARTPFPEDIELADRLLGVISDLQNVNQLNIEWKMASAPEMPFCFSLLTAFWPSLGRNLTSLSFDMNLDYLCQLVENKTGFDAIQRLSMNIGPYTLNTIKMSAAEKDQKSLATFINHISPTLQSLSISSTEHLRLCTLYDHLSFFPRLRRLALHVPFDPQHLDDPKGINTFLRSHANISDLSFTPKHCCKNYNTLWKPVVTHWADPDEWFRQVFEGTRFDSLRTLELGLNTTGGSTNQRVLPATAYIGNVVNSLECLTITGVLTCIDDLEIVLGAFSKNGKAPPKKVELEVHVLHRLVLESIAKALPNLESLDLTYRWSNVAGNCDERAFIRDMQGRWYNEWNLSVLCLRCSLPSNDLGRWPSQVAIARTIPKLSAKCKN